MASASNTLEVGSSVSNTELISVILNEIGASEFLQAFIDDGQDNSCLSVTSYIFPAQVSQRYGLPSHLATAFLVRFLTPQLSTILNEIGASEFLQRIIEQDKQDGFLWHLFFENPENLSHRYGLPLHLATAFLVQYHTPQLFTILSEIGASEFLQQIVEQDKQDGLMYWMHLPSPTVGSERMTQIVCLGSHYRLPRDKAAAFYDKVVTDERQDWRSRFFIRSPLVLPQSKKGGEGTSPFFRSDSLYAFPVRSDSPLALPWGSLER
jgi:hypothetical protein